MRVYQIYDSGDPASSDHFAPCLGNAESHIKQVYGFRPKIKFDDDGIWRQDVDDVTVYVLRHQVGSSATAICTALSVLPNR